MAELHLHWQLNDGPHDATVTDIAPTIIGRLPENTLHLPSDRVSRRHVSIRRRGEGFTVRDLTEGRNRPILNGLPLPTESLIGKGDVLVLGDVTLHVTDVIGVGPINGPALTLRWMHNNQTHTETLRSGDPATIGREETATFQIDSPTVSRAHVKIQERGGRFAVSDLTEGRNLPQVNHRPLTEERYLNPGDVLTLGHSKIDVHVVAVASSAMQATPQGIRLVTCVNCHREVDGRLLICPWCGTSLDIAQTVVPR